MIGQALHPPPIEPRLLHFFFAILSLFVKLIIFYKEVFEREGLPLRLKPYSILSTAKTTGLIEVRADGWFVLGRRRRRSRRRRHDSCRRYSLWSCERNLCPCPSAIAAECSILQITTIHIMTEQLPAFQESRWQPPACRAVCEK